jgi:signal transduction histidine kinase
MESAPHVAPPRRLLLVEDDETHAELIRRAFEDQSAITIEVARRLDEAATVLRERLPDMVIADLRLPDGRGIELCHGRDYPIVIMTSQGSEADAVEAMRAGALDYVVKSDTMFADMPHVVQRALREWGLLRAHARAERELQAQLEIATALANCASLEAAGAAIVEAICRSVQWPVGELWRVDRRADLLRRVAFFTSEAHLRTLAETPARATFARGEGFPGATWARGGALSITQPEGAPWSPGVTELGLTSSYGFPLHTAGGDTFALFTFFARDADPPNGEIDRLMRTVSAQLHVFAERQREQEERRRLQAELNERERLAAVGETAAALAHEIANPLNAMYVQAQLLQRRIAKLPELDPELHAELHAKISRDVEVLLTENIRLSDLLRDFRAMSRRGTLRVSETDVAALVDRMLELQRPLLQASGVEVVREIDDTLPTITADGAKLQQVLLNLLKNAGEAMPDGGRVTVRARAEAARIVVEVADDGPGLPEGIDVFEPFETTKPSGTGLGLSLARQVLVAHGGSIACDSTPGEGATFRLVLPLRARDTD